MLEKYKKSQLSYIVKHNISNGYKIKGGISKLRKIELINIINKNKLKIPSDIPDFVPDNSNNNLLNKIGIKKFNGEEEEE